MKPGRFKGWRAGAETAPKMPWLHFSILNDRFSPQKNNSLECNTSSSKPFSVTITLLYYLLKF